MARHVAANALTFIILGLVLVFGLVTWSQSEYRAPGPLTEELRLEVERGETFASVTRKLEDAGAVSNPALFRVAARYTDMDKGLRFGEYEIPAGASMEDVLALLNRGGNVFRQVVVPEGWTSWQVVEMLNAREECTARSRRSRRRGRWRRRDTLQRSVIRGSILNRMATRQQEILATAWAGRNPDVPVNSPEELLNLASIIEKETGIPRSGRRSRRCW